MMRSSDNRLIVRFSVDFFLLIAVYCVALIPNLNDILPHHGFYLDNQNLYYPYKPTLLTKLHIMLLTIVLPIIGIVLLEGLREICERRLRKPYFMFRKVQIPSFFSECYKLKGVYFFGLALTFIVTKFTKLQLHQLRPHFHQVCMPKFNYLSSEFGGSSTTPKIIESYVCTATNVPMELLWNLDKSFPSLHMSLATYAMGFLLFYVQARIFCTALRLYRLVLQTLFVCLAYGVGVERVTTNNNHLCDVVAGGVIGLVMAVFATIFVAQIFVQPRFKCRKPADSVNEFIISNVGNGRNTTPTYFNTEYNRRLADNIPEENAISSRVYDVAA